MSKRSMPPPPTRQSAASGVSLKRQMSKAPTVKSPAKSPMKSPSWHPMTQPNPIGSPIEYLPLPISQSFDIDEDSEFQERQLITASQALDPDPAPLEEEEDDSDSDEPEVTIVKSDGSVVQYRKPKQTASMVQEKKQLQSNAVDEGVVPVNIKGFTCVYCKVVIAGSIEDFQKHMLIHVNPDNPKTQKPLQCGLCDKRYKTWEGVKMHMEKKHERVQNYEDEMVHIRHNATKENTAKRQENRKRKREQLENTMAATNQPKRKKKKIVVISSSSSDPDMSDSSSANPEDDEEENSDESNIFGSSDEDSDEQQCPQNPLIYSECRKPKKKARKSSHGKTSWSDKKKRQKNTPKMKLSPKQKKRSEVRSCTD